MRYPDQSAPFIPKNPLEERILEEFDNPETADVIFRVIDQAMEVKKAPKRAKMAGTRLYAHRFILQHGAPLLAELCKSGTGEQTIITIRGIKPTIFRKMLCYLYGGDLYGGNLSYEDLKAEDVKELIDAADKYEVVNLKLEAEAHYVKSITLTTENILDNLLYADSKNCAHLKETVMDYIVENGVDVAEKISFDDVPGYMMKDLLTAMNRGKLGSIASDSPGGKYANMRVGVLRRLLDDEGLEVDGSRETTIARLKENDSSNECEDGEGGSGDDE